MVTRNSRCALVAPLPLNATPALHKCCKCSPSPYKCSECWHDAAGTDDYDYSGAEETGEYGDQAANTTNNSNNNKLVKWKLWDLDTLQPVLHKVLRDTKIMLDWRQQSRKLYLSVASVPVMNLFLCWSQYQYQCYWWPVVSTCATLQILWITSVIHFKHKKTQQKLKLKAFILIDLLLHCVVPLSVTVPHCNISAHISLLHLWTLFRLHQQLYLHCRYLDI